MESGLEKLYKSALIPPSRAHFASPAREDARFDYQLLRHSNRNEDRKFLRRRREWNRASKNFTKVPSSRLHAPISRLLRARTRVLTINRCDTPTGTRIANSCGAGGNGIGPRKTLQKCPHPAFTRPFRVSCARGRAF